MSNRDSLGFGDLLPQDVVDIFAQEKHYKRKKRSHSLGRALGWLKRKKRKDLGTKRERLGLGPALDLALDGHPAGHQGGHKGGQKSGKQAHPQGNGHAVPKRDDDDDKTLAPPLFQENVFIEASRPKYLENLHTEAQEGLKMMQQEETNHGVEHQDNESTISTMTVQTDGEGFMTDSTIADTTSIVSVQSSVSTRSSRSGLTRQESTFRPLNSGRKSDKTKTRRRHRKTVVGIPHHVQRELGLDRVGWTLAQRLDEEQLYNGETDGSTIEAAVSQKGASASHQDVNSVQPLSKDQLEQLDATHAGHRDDMALLHRLGPDSSGELRPRSLAVPWMTTANSLQQEPPSPVMSMSPQAAYMSKIIPNAVLPPSIEVVEISRGPSRNSVRTVSKSSLVLSSPAPSRASSRASTITSASRQCPPHLSDSSGWSNSESSETLVSDSSTISSSSTPRQKRSQDGDASAREDKISVHSSRGKSAICTANGKLVVKGDKEGPFQRSLSVMKPKRAPPPPSRSYSLHNKMKRRSRDLAEVKVIPGESSLNNSSASGHKNEKNKSGSSPMTSMIIDNHGYNADTSSLDDSTGSVSFSPIRSQLKADEAAKVEETVCRGASQEKQKSPQENKSSKVISPSSGYSSQDGRSPQTSKHAHNSSPRHKKGILAKLQRLFPGSTPADNLKPDTPVDTASASPSVRTLRDLFNIPPPPKVHAPPPPPPEVWAHSKRTFELLLGPPAPDNVYAIIKKNPKDRRQQRQSPSPPSTEGSAKSLAVERKHKNTTVTVESANGSLHMLETKTVQESGFVDVGIDKENSGSLAEQNVDLKENSQVTENGEKVRVSDVLDRMLVKAVEKGKGRLAEEEDRKSTSQASEVKNDMETLPAISLARIPPSPPLVHHPPTSVQVVSPESSWPPPPPPVGQGGLTDEIDFPLPPPPMFGEEGFVSPVQVPPKSATPAGDSCTTASIISVVKTECVRVTTEVELQKPNASQGVVPPPLSIPPPPPYTAPPPPVKIVSPPMTKTVSPSPPKEVSHSPLPTEDPSPPPKEDSPPPSKEILPPPPPIEIPPPPPKEVSPAPPKEVSPPPPKEISPPPPKEIPPPPPKEVSPAPPKEVSPPPPKEVSPPPPKEILLPPPKEIPPPPPKEVSPAPPKDVSPAPPKEGSPLPPKEVSPPPPKEILLPPPKEIPPPPPKEVSPPPPKKVSPPPPKEILLPPPKEIPPPPPKEASPPPPKEIPPTPPKEASPPPPKEASPPVNPTDSSPPLVQEAPSPLDVSPALVTVVTPSPPKEVSPLPPIEASTLSTEDVSPPSFQQNTCQLSEDVTPITKLAPPQSIPPPPPLTSQSQSSEEEIDPLQENIQSETVSILTPPKSIPPPPPIQLLLQPQVVPPTTEDPVTQEASSSPPSEASIPTALENSPSPEKVQELAPPPPVNIPVPPPLPVLGHANIKQQPSPASTENQTLELPSAPAAQVEPTLIVTPSILQKVKLRSVNSSPEPPKEEEPEAEEPKAEEPEAEVTVSNQVPTTSASEAPQKPIRRSLIVSSPTSTSPPSTLTSQTALPKSQSLVAPPATSSKALSPTRKSPPATAAPSMNLQEAIRLRTAARSQGSTASRLSLNPPTSPIDPHKSPSSTASFIFSKNNRKVVIETKTTEQKKVVNDTESVKKGVKVPPPVAKKPKTKSKEVEIREGTEQHGGQEALQESIMDAAEKTNGTAGTVEGGATPST